VWAVKTGWWPIDRIDHEDLNRGNNRWGNIRQANNAQNGYNRRAQANSQSGVKGVWYNPQRDKWQSEITADGGRRFLGRFATEDEATIAYRDAAVELHGEFSRTE
jgi:hypothetical protein